MAGRWGPVFLPPFLPPRGSAPGVTLRLSLTPRPFPRGRCVLTDWGTGMSKRAISFLCAGKPESKVSAPGAHDWKAVVGIGRGY